MKKAQSDYEGRTSGVQAICNINLMSKESAYRNRSDATVLYCAKM